MVEGRENHAFAHQPVLEGPGRKVGDEADLLAHELFGLIVLGDAADDGAVFQSVGNFELQELLHFRYTLAAEHGADADVELFEVFKSNVFADGFCLVAGLFVGLLDVEQALHLCLNHFVLNLFEEQFGLLKLMAGRQQVDVAERFPVEGFHAEHAAQFGRGERQEGLEGDGQVGHELEREVDDGLDALGVGLDDLPGLAVGQIFVADAGQVHGLLLCVAEAEVFEQALHFFLDVLELFDGVTVEVGQFAQRGHDAVVVFLRQLERTVYEVAVDGHQFVVVARLEVSPGEVVVLRFGRVGGEDVAEHILLAREVVQVFVEPHGPVAAGRNLVVLQVEEFVGRHVVGQDVAAFGLEHGGEHDAVEHDVVLADEMDEAGVLLLPPGFPGVRQQFLGVGDVADGGVKPHVEHFSFGAFHGHGDAPVEVAGYGTGTQSEVEPALALSVDIGAPLLVVLQNPLFQPLLVVVQREIPVGGLALDERMARHGVIGVDKFLGREGGTALLALVAIGFGRMAAGALALDVAVGEEFLCLLVVELLRLHFHEFPFIVEFAEKVGGMLLVRFRCGAGIDVEADAEVFERLLDEIVVAVDHFLHGDALFPGTDGDGHAMLVGTADEEHFLLFQTEVAHVDVGRYIYAGQVPDVYAAVGIRQGRCDQSTVEFLFHVCMIVSLLFGRDRRRTLPMKAERRRGRERLRAADFRGRGAAAMNCKFTFFRRAVPNSCHFLGKKHGCRSFCKS